MREKFFKEYAIITLGSLLVAIAITFFMVPGELVMGSIAGLSLVLINFIPVKISVMNLILNILFLIIGFIFVGREFGAKTIYTAIMCPVFTYMLESLFPNMQSLTNDTWMDMLCCILVVSVGQTLMFKVNASSGGLDILAKIANKYFHLELGKGCALFGILTVLSSMLVYDARTLIFGIIGTYMNGLVIDEFIAGFSRKKRVCILSDKHEEIEKFILNDINRGLTVYRAVGGYEKREKTELVTILAKNEYGQLIKYIREIDPEAFVTVASVSEIVGVWNRNGEARYL